MLLTGTNVVVDSGYRSGIPSSLKKHRPDAQDDLAEDAIRAIDIDDLPVVTPERIGSCLADVCRQGRSRVSMILKGLQSGRWHGIDRIRPDQAVDIEGI